VPRLVARGDLCTVGAERCTLYLLSHLFLFFEFELECSRRGIEHARYHVAAGGDDSLTVRTECHAHDRRDPPRALRGESFQVELADSRLRVPHLRLEPLMLVAAPGHNSGAVRAEGHARDRAGVSIQGENAAAQLPF